MLRLVWSERSRFTRWGRSNSPLAEHLANTVGLPGSTYSVRVITTSGSFVGWAEPEASGSAEASAGVVSIGVVASGAEAAGGSWTVTAGSGKSGTPADLVFFTLLVSFAWH